MRWPVALLISLSLGGCATPNYDNLAAESASRAKTIRVICVETKDCKNKWAKAVDWVARNAAYKIRIATDTIIVTEGPSDVGVMGLLSAITVTKVPQANGTVEIVFKSQCVPDLLNGCVPDGNILLVRFADFVNAV